MTRPTIARVFETLKSEGLIATKPGQRALFVANELPHHHRYYWVTSEQPGSSAWTGFLGAMLELIQRGETGIDAEVIPLVGVDGRANNPRYQRLCEVIEQGSAAGLFLMTSAIVNVLPILERASMPRVAIWTPLPHASVVSLDFDALISRAVERLTEKARSIAVLSPHRARLTSVQKQLSARGVAEEDIAALQVTPVGCREVVELLLERGRRPEAMFVTDDNLVDPMAEGLRRAGVFPGSDIYVLAHCNWPRPLGPEEGIERIGFDVREVLRAAKECTEAERATQSTAKRIIPPRFAEELGD